MSASTTTPLSTERRDPVPARERRSEPPDPPRQSATRTSDLATRLLAVIAFVLGVGALKLAAPVALPLALSVLLLALVWPLQKHLEDRMPRGSSAFIAMAVLLAVITVCAVAVFAATTMIAERVPLYNVIFLEHYSTLAEWAERQNIPYEPNRDDLQEAARRVLTVFGHGVQGMYSLLGMFVLTLLFLLFGLLEIPAFYRKLESAPQQSPGAKLLEASKTIGRRYRLYMWTKTFTSALTGIMTWLFCWICGIDLAFVWGLLAFLLNFIPNLGSIVAVVPPTVLALLQYQSLWGSLGTLLGLTTIQMTIGSYIDPRLQGKNLKLSTFVVIFSIVFWGWLWGVVGALVGVPMTVAVVALCRNFETTTWIATMLADVPPDINSASNSDHEALPVSS